MVGSRGAWFGIKRFTLNVLASRLAQHTLAAAGSAPASSLSFTAVVARAIHSLQSEGELSYFEPVATRPGFPVAVAKTLEELRMNEVDPESVGRLGRGGKDLAAIAKLVEKELTEAKLSDRAALYRAAIDSISLTENAPYLGLPLLVLDVPIRSGLESTAIRELAALSPDVLATVPQGDERTIASLEESLSCAKRTTRRRVDGGRGKLAFLCKAQSVRELDSATRRSIPHAPSAGRVTCECVDRQSFKLSAKVCHFIRWRLAQLSGE